MEQVNGNSRFERRWVILILLAPVPLLVAVSFLQLLGPPAQPLTDAELLQLRPTVSANPYLPGMIAYAAIMTIHFFACVAAMLFAGLVLAAAPHGRALASVGLAMAATISLLIMGLALIFGESIDAYRLTYFNVADLFGETGVGAWLLGAGGGANVLALGALVPTVLGVFAVALTAAAATGQLSLLSGRSSYSEEDWEALLCLAHVRIKRCAYALSFVLVTSTVAATMFFQLPAEMSMSAGSSTDLASFIAQAQARIAGYGAELSMFWGAVYSLTLFAAVGLPLLLVQKEVRDFLEALKPPERAKPFRTRLNEAGVISSGGEQLKVLVAFVAPLVSAPVTSFLQAATL